MRTLAIDCATEACSVALFEGSGSVRPALLAGEMQMLGRGHAEHLVPMIARLPDRGRASRIVVSLGPGSFTGVRIGLAAARALGLAWNARVHGYPTLALVAAMARDNRGAQPVCVAMTGGHGEWFVAGYDAGGGETRAVSSVGPADAASVPEMLVAGSQAEALIALRKSGEALPIWPDARQFALLEAGVLQEPAPIYGRPPDARLPGGAAR